MPYQPQTIDVSALSRRDLLRGAARAAAAAGTLGFSQQLGHAAAPPAGLPLFVTRGVVLVVRDMKTLDWPARAKRAGLTTIATHIRPSEIAAFVKTKDGAKFLADCRQQGLQVEHELHAMSDLLPRSLFDKDSTMFRMDDRQERVCDFNLCVHSRPAIETVCENVARYTRLLPATTSRYFYWIDDGRPMCRCPKCRELSDSDQALLLENHMLEAARSVDSQATLAHLVYHNTLQPPTKIKPQKGIFLEFAPIQRTYDRSIADRAAKGTGKLTHGDLLKYLDANLAVFGAAGAQVLEYWLDVSRFSGWKRDRLTRIVWHDEVYRQDLEVYASRGIRDVTTFAAWIDGDYVRRFGNPPLAEYGAGMLRWFWRDGRPVPPVD